MSNLLLLEKSLSIHPEDLEAESWTPTEAEMFAGYTYGRVPEDNELDQLGNFDVDRWVNYEGHFPKKNKP